MRSKDYAVTEAAKARGWVMTTKELRGLGCGTDWIARRVREGWITPLHRGVYLVGRRAPTRDELDRAALLACGPRSVLTGRSAAARFGLLHLSPDSGVMVAAPTDRRVLSRGIECRRRQLLPHEVTIRHGLPTVTIPAMLGELTWGMYRDELARLIHEAEIRKLLNVAAVERWIAEHPRRHGVSELRAALSGRRDLVGSVGSGLEGEFHAFARWARLPQTEHNVLFEADCGFHAVDVLFRKQWLAVEVDGAPHRSSRNFVEDRQRDRWFDVQFGLPVFRVTGPDLGKGKARLAIELWAALARRDESLQIPAKFARVVPPAAGKT